jgi:hypothetical protein
MPPSSHAPTELPWIATAVPRPLMRQLPRPVSRPLALHEAELPARHYLASRGERPMVARPLRRALPLLLRDVVRERVAGWRDLGLALGMLAAALALLGSVGLMRAPGGGFGVVQQLLQGLVGLTALGWAGLALRQAVPRLWRARRIRGLLKRGEWPAAFRAALGE